MLLLESADFSKLTFFHNFFSGALSVSTVWIQIRTDRMSVLIWAQTVCKGYPQTAKVDASKERVNNKINLSIITSIYHSLSFLS